VTLTSVSGQLNIQNDPVNGGNAAAYQNLTTVAGKVYRITFDWKSGSGDVRARDGSISGTSLAQAISSGAGSYSLSFVATSTTTVIAVSNNAVTVGLTSVIDNISVREIKPLSVSIQMDGRMTYADEGSNAQDMFVYWVKDASNYIQIYTDTRAADTGQIRFNQTAAGVADVIDSSGTAYSPGILVPYNIASRHGSTFINGAVDGTALTADLTPVALPDLSSTNLSLGYDYMGTINQFRVWSQDLGDTGIVEATEPSLEPSLSLTFDGSGSSFIVEDWV
jgi:hypothetical protein